MMMKSTIITSIFMLFALLLSIQIGFLASQPLNICYKPGTDLRSIPEEHTRAIKRYELMGGRWTATAKQGANLPNGVPTLLTWSIIPDGTVLNGALGEDPNPNNLTATLLDIYGNSTAYMAMFQMAFTAWQQVAGVTFYYEPNDDGAPLGSPGVVGTRGDIRIGGHYIDGDYGCLAYTFGPNVGWMVLDTSDTFFWSDPWHMHLTVTHELGHALGLMHSCPGDSTKIMEPVFSENILLPQHDDIRGVQHWYGDRLEGRTTRNDQEGEASDLGVMPSGGISIENLSLDNPLDIDYYKFTASATGSVSVTVSPNGYVYNEGAQNADGCDSFVLINSNVFIMKVNLVTSTGTVLATATSAGPGMNVTVTATNVAANSEVYIEVLTNSDPVNITENVQMYSIAMSQSTQSIAAPAATIAASASSTSAPSVSRSSTPSASRTAAASLSSSATVSKSASNSISRSASISMTATASHTAAASASHTAAASQSAAASISKSAAASQSAAASASHTAAASQSAAASISKSAAASQSAAASASKSTSGSLSQSVTLSPSKSSTPAISGSPTISASYSSVPSVSASKTQRPTSATPSHSLTRRPTFGKK